jgi:hypothetical protein
MEDKSYKGQYEVIVVLTDTAWSNPEFNKEIKSGKIEKIISELTGEYNFWKDLSKKTQNTIYTSNARDAFYLMNKLNELPYIGELTLKKDNSKKGYIPITK